MQPAALELLRDFAAAADAMKARWYLFGAQAAIIHGQPRLTADVDVTVSIPQERLAEFAAALTQARFRSRVADLLAFAAETRVLPLVHEPTGFPVDVVLAGPGLEEEILSRALPLEVDGLTLPVISPEDLLVLKVLAGRSKDLEDVRGVLRRSGARLDLDAVRSRLAELDTLLDRADLVETFEDALQSTRRR